MPTAKSCLVGRAVSAGATKPVKKERKLHVRRESTRIYLFLRALVGGIGYT